jgi:hypothetical protein
MCTAAGSFCQVHAAWQGVTVQRRQVACLQLSGRRSGHEAAAQHTTCALRQLLCWRSCMHARSCC